MKRIHILILLLLCLSCETKWEINQPAKPTIVVEGWIESGKPAMVILTQLLPFVVESGAEEEFDLNNLPLKWATVKLSDGENEEMLVGMYNDRYVPPYVYAGSEIIGEEGKTYTLSVKYPGVEVTAKTTMPGVVPIDDVVVKDNPSNPEEYSINLYFKDDVRTKDYYKIFTRIRNEDTRFYSSFINNVDDAVFSDENANVVVNRSFRHIGMDILDYSPYFLKTDTVKVQLAHLPEEGYEFWDSYENDVTNGSNILFPSNTNLKTNIHGGRGIWCAYAVDIVDVIYEP